MKKDAQDLLKSFNLRKLESATCLYSSNKKQQLPYSYFRCSQESTSGVPINITVKHMESRSGSSLRCLKHLPSICNT